MFCKQVLLLALFATALCAAPPADIKAKVEKAQKEWSFLSNDPKVVAEVKAFNTNPPAELQGMSNAKWKELTILSPEVRNLTRNALGQYLKSIKKTEVAELFINGANGGKVAFLGKTTNWTHKGSAKHDNPMASKPWMGDVELDESTGKQQVQFAIPVLDGKTPIGSIVIGVSIADLK